MELGKIICKVCGRETKLKMNVNGLIFVYCRNKLGVRDDNTAIICGHQEKFSYNASVEAFEMYKDGKNAEEIYDFLKNYTEEMNFNGNRRTNYRRTNNYSDDADEFEPINFDW